MPKASIGIIVRNERDSIGHLLDSLLSQDFKSYEIVVVDGSSTDGTWEILKRYSAKHRKIRIFSSSQGKSGADRNVMLSHVFGKYLAVIDAGAIPQNNWLSEIVSEFEKQRKKYPKLAGMGGKTTYVRDTWQKRAIYAFLETPIGSGGSMQMNEHILGFTLIDSVIKRVKYPQRHGAEDFGLNHNLIKKGYAIGITEKAGILHNYIDSFDDFIKKIVGYGKMQIRALKQSREIRWYVPVVFFYGIYHIIALALALFGIFFPILLSIYLQLVFFFFFGIIYSVKKRNAVFLLSFLFYPTQYFAYFIGIMKALLNYRRL
jgi:glycosyltransferase involved in cell wall biosynthesis